MNALLNVGLVLHICGISLLVGMTAAGFISCRRIFVILRSQEHNATPLLKLVALFTKMQMLGGGFIILGGIMMMIAFQGLIMGLLWFKLKLVLLMLLLLNVPLMLRPANLKLFRFISGAVSDLSVLDTARRLFNSFYIIQLLLFLGIFLLSVFRFN